MTEDTAINKNLVYIKSQIACAMIKLEAMRVQNAEDRRCERDLSYNFEDFENLIEEYGIYHNAVITETYRGVH